MKPIKTASLFPAQKHGDMPARMYTLDPVQADRIRRAKVELVSAMTACTWAYNNILSITELCCGSCDITGEFSAGAGTFVRGVDLNNAALQLARLRFPNIYLTRGLVQDIPVFRGDVLVMCETLEHLPDPKKVLREWAPLYKTMVIGHPVHETEDSLLSNGEHCWSFTQEDFLNWFRDVGYTVQHFYEYDMENLRMIVGWGTNNAG